MERRRRESTGGETEGAAAVGMALEPGPWSARVDAFRRFEVEKPNLYEVLGSCLSDGDAETGLRLCAGLRLVWIVNGTFAEGAAWIDKFLAFPEAAAVTETVRGRALISRAQLAMASGSPEADEQASAGLELCWAAGEQFWVAAGLNLLTEIALHSGHPDVAAERAEEALQVARSAGDRWNEGYALGTMAAIAGYRGNFRAAQRLGEEALLVMREIQQLWGSARALLGLGDLAQQRGEHGVAREYYLEALAVLRVVDARPEIARCLAGLGRIALDQWDLVSARQHLTESLRLSYASGSRIGMARGLEALARLAVVEGNPALSVQLAGAMTALRAQAHLPPVRGARTQRFLDAAAGLGEHTVRRLWAEGEAMTPTDAVRLALGAHADVFGLPATGPSATGPSATGTAVADGTAAAAGPATALTQREHEVVALLAAGLSNRDIAAKLFISPATAARHVANILAKLGFSSRSQVAAWAAAQPASQPGPDNALDSPS
jgi:DNA-binding CsgD family transcriptional regulator